MWTMKCQLPSTLMSIVFFTAHRTKMNRHHLVCLVPGRGNSALVSVSKVLPPSGVGILNAPSNKCKSFSYGMLSMCNIPLIML